MRTHHAPSHYLKIIADRFDEIESLHSSDGMRFRVSSFAGRRNLYGSQGEWKLDLREVIDSLPPKLKEAPTF